MGNHYATPSKAQKKLELVLMGEGNALCGFRQLVNTNFESFHQSTKSRVLIVGVDIRGDLPELDIDRDGVPSKRLICLTLGSPAFSILETIRNLANLIKAEQLEWVSEACEAASISRYLAQTPLMKPARDWLRHLVIEQFSHSQTALPLTTELVGIAIIHD
ncbi:MAG: hypothetical protein GW822_08275 [Sphingomonadales bacterium]|nr:hypothetical protein [Sphingomonadales bacterium]NCO50021.1 hypothetical protein [Sphingomonadales bacterium]NCP43415.1 hypothetical protein [Sphingomonadales bacterium]NCP50043.1 hypothetical protein [Sphingomonadales bacterium]